MPLHTRNGKLSMPEPADPRLDAIDHCDARLIRAALVAWERRRGLAFSFAAGNDAIFGRRRGRPRRQQEEETDQ